jgi:hypothetical protein
MNGGRFAEPPKFVYKQVFGSFYSLMNLLISVFLSDVIFTR